MSEQRINTILKSLRRSKTPVALIVSSSSASGYPNFGTNSLQQDSDFYYLTGSEQQDAVLLISSRIGKPILLCTKRSAIKVAFNGKLSNQKTLAKKLGVEMIEATDPQALIWPALKGIRRLYHNGCGLAHSISLQLAALPVEYRADENLPVSLLGSEELIAPYRSIKDRQEVKEIEEAALISSTALLQTLPLIKAGVKEYQVAATIDYWIKMFNCGIAFPTIVASGPSAATLHYSKLDRTLRRGDLVLIDFGARNNHYAADITRVIPVNGSFSPIQREIYSVVLNAQKSVISKIKPGVTVEKLHKTAVTTLTAGLIELKVLRGKLSSLIAAGAYRPYFPHGIGHALGLNVHDVGEIRSNHGAVLEKGMVITVEPGLYFSVAIGKVPACGIRIEDDVLVTRDGCQVLTEAFPKELDEIEAIIAEN